METQRGARALGLGELARTLARRMGALARKEMELVRAELSEDVRHGRVAGELGAASAVAFIAAFACAVVALVDGLARAMPLWLASAITGVALLIAAVLLVRQAALAARAARPQRSIESARAAVEMLKEGRTP